MRLHKTSRPRLALALASGSVLILAAIGCKSEKEGPSARDRQDKALRDPFAYGPDSSMMKGGKKDDVDPTDISGGDIGTLNKKAMKRDLDAVFGP